MPSHTPLPVHARPRAQPSRAQPSRGGWPVWVEIVALLCLVLSAACAPRVTALHRVPPAFPVVLGGPLLVLGEASPTDLAAAQALAGGLGAAGLPVRFGGPTDVAPGERLLVLRLAFESRWDRQWTTRPETVCGAFGCQVRQASVLVDVPVLTAELHATVRAADGTLLAGHTVRDQATRTDASDVRAALVRRLVLRLARDLSPSRFEVRFRWPRTRDDAFDRLAPMAERRQFEALVPALREALAAHGSRLAAPRRARALVALAWALRLAAPTSEDPVAVLGEASAALAEARALEANAVPVSLPAEVEHERALYLALRSGSESTSTPLPVPPTYR